MLDFVMLFEKGSLTVQVQKLDGHHIVVHVSSGDQAEWMNFLEHELQASTTSYVSGNESFVLTTHKSWGALVSPSNVREFLKNSFPGSTSIGLKE